MGTLLVVSVIRNFLITKHINKQISSDFDTKLVLNGFFFCLNRYLFLFQLLEFGEEID